MKLSVVKFIKNDTSQWNDFVSGAKNGLFLFNRTYMEYHEDRFTDHSLVMYKGEKIIGIFPANENEKKIYSHAGLTFGGILYSNEIKANEAVDLMGLVIQYYRENGFEEINYKAIPYLYHQYPCQEDLYALFRHDAVLYRRDLSSAIELSHPLRFSETKRQSIHKCGQMGMRVNENNDFSEYWVLLQSVLEKFGVKPVHTLEEIIYLKKNFNDKIKLYEARLDEELLAGVVIYDYGKVVHTQYMGNAEKGRSLGALDFINATLINSDFKDRAYYSFGTSTEQEGRVLNEGLVQLKEMLGGRAIANDFYKITV